MVVGWSEHTVRKNLPRITIASTQGHAGKTVVSLGLCAAFKEKGITVQSFKRGPDYIDPSWLTAASGRNCRNLDSIMMPEKKLLASFTRASRDADISIIEGAMGLFDGFDSEGRGSTAHISRLLNSPIILLVNTSRMTRSIAALVSGFQHFESKINIAGVILNNVAGARHEKKLRETIEKYCGIPVVGSLPGDSKLNISERHLGLVPYPEVNAKSKIEDIRKFVENNLDLDLIQKIACKAGEIDTVEIPPVKEKTARAKIGVIFDKVFNFYYPENLEALKQAGAELVFLDSINDLRLPDVDALYIGGGFPELFLPQLEANSSLRGDINKAIENYMPVYAECAGLMYLCRSIKWKGCENEMVGALPASVELSARPQAHGYACIEVNRENPLFRTGLKFWGHEFHYSRLTGLEKFNFTYRVLHGQGIDGKMDGILYKNVVASFVHIHALGVPSWADNLVKLARKSRTQKVPLSTIRK